MNGTDLMLACGAGVMCALAAVCVRGMRAELAGVMRLSFCVVFAALLLRTAAPITAQLRTLADGETADYVGLLLRALGIAWLSGLTADICRDCGESGVASGIETLGKLEILTLCLPLIASVLNTVREVLSW